MQEEAEILFKKTLSRAMFYCSKAERCPADLFQKFKSWHIPEHLWDRLIEKLTEDNFLSEQRFVRAFINDKLRYNKWGKRKVAYQLKMKGLSAALFTPALAEFEETEYRNIISNEMRKRVASINESDPYKFRAKLYNFAAGRGYEPEMTESIIETLTINNNDS